MKKIEDNLFEKYYSLIDYDRWSINKDLIKDNLIKKSLDNFILLKYYSELFNEINTLNIYYNEYFWYSKMKFDYINKYGKDDLNFEQGQFKLIEEGEQYENVDWSIIEDIHKQFEI